MLPRSGVIYVYQKSPPLQPQKPEIVPPVPPPQRHSKSVVPNIQPQPQVHSKSVIPAVRPSVPYIPPKPFVRPPLRKPFMATPRAKPQKLVIEDLDLTRAKLGHIGSIVPVFEVETQVVTHSLPSSSVPMRGTTADKKGEGVMLPSAEAIQPTQTVNGPKLEQTGVEIEVQKTEVVKTDLNSMKVDTTHLTVVPQIISDRLSKPEVQHSVQKMAQTPKKMVNFRRVIGVGITIAAIIGMIVPIIPQARQETSYALKRVTQQAKNVMEEEKPLPPAAPINFSPLVGPDGKTIEPINTDFSIIVPKLGINAAIIASVDPLSSKEYIPALEKGVAHAKTSYFPNQDGAVYLFSHSTNYQWFVKDLNAIFYNVKDLSDGDSIILYYQGKRYTYAYKSREVTKATNTTYLLPVTGKRQLILQTCYPPGTTVSRLLIFADLVEEKGIEI